MNAFLRILGFHSRDDDDDTLADYPSALPIQSPSRAAAPDAAPGDGAAPGDERAAAPAPAGSGDDALATTAAAPPASGDDHQTAFPITIFDSLLEVFNEAQPDFIRKCLDMNAQRRYLYERVDESFRSYIEQIKEGVRRRSYRERDLECRRMTQEIDRLREQLRDHAKMTDDFKALRASADRQKRTFNDRIHDLEQQLAAALAGKEQADLEVKSLANKLKVQQVQQGDCDPQEIAAMRSRLAEAEATMKAAEERVVAAEARCRDLQARLDSSDQQLRQAQAQAAQAQAAQAQAAQAAPFEPLPAPAAEAQSPILPSKSDKSDRPERPAVAAEPPAKKYRPRQRKDMPRISAIDESMDSTEWLVATPPEGVSMKIDSSADSDFGYQDPPRKPQPPESDAQMTLF